MTEERKVEVTIEEPEDEPKGPTVEVNVEEPDKPEDEDDA